LLAALAAAALLLTPGCSLLKPSTTTPDPAKVAQVQNLSYAAASIGTGIALAQNPNWRPQFELAYTNLNSLVESKLITGSLIRQIISTLPIKELKSQTAVIAIDGATYLFDTVVGTRLNVENDPYVLAAATGIRDGLRIALYGNLSISPPSLEVEETDMARR
jgi:hypothetical protein